VAVMTASSTFDRARTRYLDLYIVVVTLALAAFGGLAIYSAAGAGPLTASNLAVRQFAYFVLGIGLMIVFSLLDYRIFRGVAPIIYGLSIAALAAVLVVGKTVNGAQRWFSLKVIDFQPSEAAKIGVILALAAFISSRGEKMARWYNFLIALAIVMLPALLIYRQPDLGTALVFVAIWAAMMGISRTRLIYFAGIVVAAVPAAILLWNRLPAYQQSRFDAFLDPSSPKNISGEGYNIIQAQNSISSGGVAGNGIHGGILSDYDFLKVRTTDFIFAHAAAMFGFLGCLALIALFMLLIWRYAKVVSTAGDSFGQLIAMGITAQLLFQVVVNIGMNARMLPVTGVPLPFISYGGTQLWMLLVGQGLMQSILMRHQKFVIG
jgi:rod shape determining protein RodA